MDGNLISFATLALAVVGNIVFVANRFGKIEGKVDAIIKTIAVIKSDTQNGISEANPRINVPDIDIIV